MQTISEEPPVLKGAQQYWNLMSVEVRREDGSSSRVAGAVFGNQPHIVQVGEHLLRASRDRMEICRLTNIARMNAYQSCSPISCAF